MGIIRLQRQALFIVSHVQRIGCQSEKLLYTVANPARDLLKMGKCIQFIHTTRLVVAVLGYLKLPDGKEHCSNSTYYLVVSFGISFFFPSDYKWSRRDILDGG